MHDKEKRCRGEMLKKLHGKRCYAQYGEMSIDETVYFI